MNHVGGQPSRALRAARISNSVAFASKGFVYAILLTGLPQLRDRHGLSNSAIVAGVVLISLLAVLGSRVAGALARKWSSRTAVQVSLVLVASSTAGVAVAPNTIVLFVALGSYGLTTGMVNASTNMQHALIQHAYQRFVTASFYAIWAIGSIFGALYLAAAVKLELALRESMLTAAAIVLLVCAITGPRLLSHEQQHRADSPATTPATTPLPIPLRRYLPFGLALMLGFAIDLGINNWSALYLTDDLASSASTAALPVAAFQAASVAALLTGDLWVRTFGPRAVMLASASLATAGMGLVVTAPNPTVAILGFGVCGIGLPVITPLCFSEAGRLARGRERDALIARLNMFPYAGTLAGGAIVGLIADHSSLRIGLASLLAFAVALVFFAKPFHPRTDSTADRATDSSGLAPR
ncbi:MFS transporter [Nocardia brasiliensis]|uniref:MFS transporter n=1 Tax=Nocardia brasiliensis TaxID=37326 RepID=UPI002456B158|nr:MFS transporter [Nocardia brasiliensis]